MVNHSPSKRWRVNPRLQRATLALLLGLFSASNTTATERALALEHQRSPNGLYYVKLANPTAKARIVFIHGSPGRWQDWQGFFEHAALHSQAELIAFDRPGFGQSAQSPLPHIDQQAQQLNQALTHLAPRPTLLVGWSYGGPIAVAMSAENPDIQALVLVAASLSADLEYPRWYNKLLDLAPIRWLAPRFARHSNDEMMNLAADLRQLAPRYAKTQQRVYLLQGGKDPLVFPETYDYALTQFSAKRLEAQWLPEAGHAIVWHQPEQVVQTLLQALAEQGLTNDASG